MSVMFPPLSALTPTMASTEFAQARYLLSKRPAAEALPDLAKITKRYAQAQHQGLLPGENIVDRVWEAAEINGIVQHHSVDTVQNIIASALEYVDAHPNEEAPKAGPIKATPYSWIEPQKITPRDWVYGHLLIRKFLTATVAPGGVGKSSLIAAEALAMTAGKDLLGVQPTKRLNVWLWNLEDPLEETARKIQATAICYELSPDDIGRRLFVDSGRDQSLVVATGSKNGTTIVRPVIDSLIHEVIDRQIDVLTIDPFVSCHEVSENDNQAMDMIAKEWAKVADKGNCAVHLVHHTRKMGGTESEVTTDTSRGAKALTDACRVVRAINRMSKEEGERAGVANHRLHFRTFNDKANLAPPLEKSDWFKLESVDLGNGPHLGMGGDSIGVVATWEWPDAFDGVTTRDLFAVQKVIAAGSYKQDVKAKEWVGLAVADVLGLDAQSEADRTKIKTLLKTWVQNKALKVVRKQDESRHERPFVEVGEWATS